MEKALPAIPAKRYFTIGEVSELCGVKPYVLRYWEQEFTQLKPMKRRGNRRYYQHHEVLLIRRIRELLYDQGFTISGARNRLAEMQGLGRHGAAHPAHEAELHGPDDEPHDLLQADELHHLDDETDGTLAPHEAVSLDQLRIELLSIRSLLTI
ncbi:MerR family transcriptional regulator [Aquincola tertiaricarbonis]|uniref:MerR family transcriptional regulator n=1 Tax=Aquincola tertiaricarbonis TaxID=391953 RepID=UPI0006152382|nr:MerR family transcriptional regulator [Aquincola tertiaricarbonis]